MSQLSNYSVAKIRAFQDRLREGLAGARALDEAAQFVTSMLVEEFAESIILARVYATVRFESLPRINREFVEALVRKAGIKEAIAPAVPVLSLMGTYGVNVDWCDRRRSRGHVGLPLVSPDFVSSLPMIASLMAGLGVAPHSFDRTLPRSARSELQPIDGSRIFHVLDARTAQDLQGRHIIPSQTFVVAYGVKTVFGVGGTWPNGSLVACVVFAREPVPRAVAHRFAPIVGVFRSCTTRLAMAERFFSGPSDLRPDASVAQTKMP
jgi:hypothetical protein